MREWQLLGRTRSLLEIGCGIGRFQKALALDAFALTGIDVSANMFEAARARCAGCANVTLHDICSLPCKGKGTLEAEQRARVGMGKHNVSTPPPSQPSP